MNPVAARIIFAAFIVFSLLLFKVLLFLPNFIRLRKYLKTELVRSTDPQERKYWKRELWKLRFCFLPFVTVNNVDTLFRIFGWKK